MRKHAALLLLLSLIGTTPGMATTTWQEQLSPELYPGLQEKSGDEIALAGLAALYPGRILQTPPPTTSSATAGKKPLQATFAGNIAYWRFYQISSALPEPASPPRALIVDLRYLQTRPDQTIDCLNFSAQVFGVTPRLKTLGDYPLPTPSLATAEKTPARIIVLVNHKTSGPIEAVLADLQARGKTILVGTASAGQTASYQPFENRPGWWRASGEIQTETLPTSHVGTGVIPQMQVAASPENDLLAWQWIERGATPESVLRLGHLRETTTASNTDQPAAEDSPGTDLILQRGYDVLAALQVVEGMTASKH